MLEKSSQRYPAVHFVAVFQNVALTLPLETTTDGILHNLLEFRWITFKFTLLRR